MKLPIKVFDVILHPRLEHSWIHFDIEATDEDGKEYYERSHGYGSYSPPYPAFPFDAVENHFTEKCPWGYKLEPLDINQIIQRLNSYAWQAGIKSLKFSDQVYVCPKSYVVWKSEKEKKEGVSYFEIKELPKDKKNIYVCREQRYELRKFL